MWSPREQSLLRGACVDDLMLASICRGLGEPGRPRLPHKQEIAGSNPASAPKFRAVRL